MATKDLLIGRPVRVLPDATTLKGQPHPQAGQQGTVEGRTPGGKQYQVRVGDAIINLPMDSFEVLGATADPTSGNTLPLDALATSRTNRPVAEDEALQEMAATIKLYGVLQPILVRKLPADRLQDTFEDHTTRHATHEIIAGERRWRAARIAGLRAIPVLIKDADAPHALVMQLVENLHRADLTALDEATGILRLIEEHGYTREQAADALRKSRTHIYEALRLPGLCADALVALRQGTLKRSVALLVAQRPTPALQQEFTRKVLTGGPDNGPLSYRAAAQPDTAKPALKPKGKGKAAAEPKTTATEAQAAIAQAMAAADGINAFEPGQTVRVRIDLKNHKGTLQLTKGAKAVITSKTGDRAWMLDVQDLPTGKGLIADYTELEAIE